MGFQRSWKLALFCMAIFFLWNVGTIKLVFPAQDYPPLILIHCVTFPWCLSGACPNSVDIVVLMDVSDSFTENDLIWMKLGVLTLASRWVSFHILTVK